MPLLGDLAVASCSRLRSASATLYTSRLPCGPEPCYAVPCAVPCRAVLRRVVPSRAVPNHAMLCRSGVTLNLSRL